MFSSEAPGPQEALFLEGRELASACRTQVPFTAGDFETVIMEEPFKNRPAQWFDYPFDQASGGVCSPEELSRELSRRVEKRIADGEYTEENVRYISCLQLPLSRSGLDVSDEILEKLRRLCQLWNVRLLPKKEITSHRPVIGRFIVAFKKLLFPLVEFVMKDVLHQQRSFNAVAIQVLAEVAHNSSSSQRDKREEERSLMQ